MPYIRESILTTVDEAGEVHIAPLGIIQEGENWIIAPFRPSKTLENLLVNQTAVTSYTDDVRIFAGCLTGRKDWPLAVIENCSVPRLSGALSHSVLEVIEMQQDELRPRFICRVASEEMHAAYLGMNRAKAAVLELAILVSRLHILSRKKIEAELTYLNIAIEKTAGPAEQEAWGWLMERVNAHLRQS